MARETASDIDRTAALWAARVDRGLTPAEEAEFAVWQSGDARRLGSYGRVRAIALQTERAAALGASYDPAAFEPAPGSHGLTRRALVATGGALAAGVAGIGILSPSLFRSARSFQSRKGEIRQIALGDGSVVTLNTASEVAVHLSASRRDLELIRGEALFDVAHDKARPFFVTAGEMLVRVVGTSFTMQRLPDRPVQLLVREGVVDVSRAANASVPPVRVRANAQATVAPASSPTLTPVAVTQVPDAELHRQLAWQDGHIAFEGQSLDEAAAEFARYSDTKIVISDPTLGKEEIAGLYLATDPVGFARTVALSLNVHAEVESGQIRITR
jgi:transmembrane sensor